MNVVPVRMQRILRQLINNNFVEKPAPGIYAIPWYQDGWGA